MLNDKIVYIERKNKQWFSENCAIAAKGFQSLGYNVKPFLKFEIKKLPLTKQTIVRGSIRTTRKAFDKVGIPQPKNIDIPESIKHFANRKIWETTFGQIKKDYFDQDKSIFIKPLEKQKWFNGFLFLGNFTENVFCLPDDFKILASEAVTFINEYRFYVLNKKILGSGVYKTSSWHTSEISWSKISQFASNIIESYKDSAIAYGIDVGVFIEPQTQQQKLGLVEINSGFSIGAVSTLSSENYAKIIEATWRELATK